MATPAPWPTEIPQGPEAAGYSVQDAISVVRSTVGYGPQYSRQRSSMYLPTVNVTIRLTSAQIPVLRDFYGLTLRGVMPFEWIDYKTLMQSCSQPPVVSFDLTTYRFLTPLSYRPIGDGSVWDVSFTIQGIGDSGAAQAGVPCIPVRPPVYVEGLPITTEFLMGYSVCGAIGNTEFPLFSEKNNTENTFIDRDNGNILGWATQGPNSDGSLMEVWNMDDDAHVYSFNPNFSVNNRAYGFGFSWAGGGAIDRYVMFYRTNTDARANIFLTTGNTPWAYTTWTSETSGFANAVDSLDFIGVTRAGFHEVIHKDNSNDPDPLPVYSQIETSAGYDFFTFRVGMPEKNHYLQSWVNQSTNNYGFGIFTPTAADNGGTAGTIYDSGLSSPSNLLKGGTYDGNNIWVGHVLSGTPTFNLLKLAPSGQLQNSFVIAENLSDTGDQEVWSTLDYDPFSGFVTIAPGNGTIYFFDITRDAVTATRDIGYGGSFFKYYGERCSLYSLDNFGSDPTMYSVLKTCILCPG